MHLSFASPWVNPQDNPRNSQEPKRNGTVFWYFLFIYGGGELFKDQSLFKSEGDGGENVFDANKFPDPNLIAFMFFRYPYQLLKKIRTPLQI